MGLVSNEGDMTQGSTFWIIPLGFMWDKILYNKPLGLAFTSFTGSFPRTPSGVHDASFLTNQSVVMSPTLLFEVVTPDCVNSKFMGKSYPSGILLP